MKIMDFQDFRWFHEIDWPDHCGWATPDGQGSFPVRKRAFPRRFEMFEQYFQHFPGFGGRYRVAETTRSHQNDENVENWWKSWIFIISATPSGLDDSVPTTKTWKCWKYAPIFYKHLGNARFRAGKTPLTIWGGLPVLVGSLNFVNFQKSWKIMIFDDFQWFSSFPYSSAMGA